MQQFNAAFCNELTKIFKKRKTFLFYAIDIAIIAIYHLLQNVSDLNIFTLSALGSMFNLHGIFFMAIFPLYIFVETLDTFNGEMSTLTIRNALVRPITRIKIYLAKVSSVCAFIFIQILFVGILSNDIAVFAISFIPMVAFVFFAAFLSQIVKNSLLGMLLCILFLLISYAAEALSPTISAFLFVRHISIYKMLLTENIQIFNIFSALFIIAAYIGVTFTAGALIFEKKEF